MTMLEKRLGKIEDYNSLQLDSPLCFCNSRGKEIKISKDDLKFNPSGTPHRRNLVKVILDYTYEWYSKNTVTGDIETEPGRNRSIIDIWRHAIYLYPGLGILRLMEASFDLCERREICGQFCHKVERTVFRSHDLFESANTEFDCEEYGIRFSTWKKLHE